MQQLRGAQGYSGRGASRIVPSDAHRDCVLLRAPMTDSEELALVNQALEALYKGGQSVSVLGRAVTRADLTELQARRDELTRRVNRSRTGIRHQRMVSND